MASMRDIRRRIRVVKNIQQITNAMKMVAAARLKKAQERAEAARPYSNKMRDVMSSLSTAAQGVQNPLLEVRPEEKIGVVVIGAERGLAGSYNINIMRKTMELLDGRDPQTVRMILLGRKSISFFRRKPYPVVETAAVPSTGVSFSDIRDVTETIRSLFESQEVDAVYLVYAKFINAITQAPTAVKLLPIEPPKEEESAFAPTEYIFEPDAFHLFDRLLPRYVDTLVYSAVVEAVASELGARMTAMSAATTNASDMIQNLTLSYNKARQAAITKELIEVVSGAQALS